MKPKPKGTNAGILSYDGKSNQWIVKFYDREGTVIGSHEELHYTVITVYLKNLKMKMVQSFYPDNLKRGWANRAEVWH